MAWWWWTPEGKFSMNQYSGWKHPVHLMWNIFPKIHKHVISTFLHGLSIQGRSVHNIMYKNSIISTTASHICGDGKGRLLFPCLPISLLPILSPFSIPYKDWLWPLFQVNISTYDWARINLDSYEFNPYWEILETNATTDLFYYECCPDERYPNVMFSIKVYYDINFAIYNVSDCYIQ